MDGGRWQRRNGKCLDFRSDKGILLFFRFETPAEIFLGHLREDRGGVRISVLRYWHTFGFSVLRAQDLRKYKEDENMYKAIDRDITRSMLSTVTQCDLRKMHTELWSPAIGLATNAIHYWDVRIKHKGNRNPMSGVLNYYLSLSDVEDDAHDKPLPVEEFIKQINQSREKLKDVVANAKEHRTQFEVELATAIVEHKHPYFCDRNEYDPVDKDNLVAKVLKTRDNQKTAKRSWKKLGR
jgi:hypothetical protein